jgi:hypothetical protein
MNPRPYRLLKTLTATSVLIASLVAGQTMCSGAAPGGFTIAQLKYRGGGDWYANPTALPNLLSAVRSRTEVVVADRPATVSLDDEELFLYPMIHMTGHGRVAFSDEEAATLRRYLERGGFLWADDNYGMDRYLRLELDRVLPDAPLVEIPFDHEIYHSFYDFPDGLPKIHEHDGGPPHGYGAFLDGRMVVFYSFNTDIGDGLEDAEVHNDPPEKHEAALRMGVNIVVHALTH